MSLQKWLGVLVATVCLVVTVHAADADLKALIDRVNALEAKNAELERRATAEAGKDKALDNAAAATDAATSATANVTTGGQKLTIGGYLDTSFEYNFNQPSNNNSNLRVFDNDANGFNVHLAELTFNALPEKPGQAGFEMDIAYGTDTRVFAPTDKYTWQSQARQNGFIDTCLKQAYIEYLMPVGCDKKNFITLDMGQFVTWAGAETIEAADNINSSRSLLFGYAIPFTHTGVRATYKVFDSDCNKWTVGGAIVNGWNNTQDQNRSKTGALFSDWTPTKWFEMVADAYVGKEDTTDNRDTLAAAVLAGGDPTSAATPGNAGLLTGNTFLGSLDGGRDKMLFAPVRTGLRYLIDTTMTFKPTICGKQDLTLALNGDFGSDSGNKWFGAAAYAKWQFAKKWYLGVRAEYFDDSNGFTTGVPQVLYEGTVTLDYAMTDALHSRLEFRHDHSDQSVFSDKHMTDPTAGPNLHSPFSKQFQNTIMYSWLYKF